MQFLMFNVVLYISVCVCVFMWRLGYTIYLLWDRVSLIGLELTLGRWPTSPRNPHLLSLLQYWDYRYTAICQHFYMGSRLELRSPQIPHFKTFSDILKVSCSVLRIYLISSLGAVLLFLLSFIFCIMTHSQVVFSLCISFLNALTYSLIHCLFI